MAAEVESAFVGFLPQVTEYLGPMEWVEEPTAHGPNRGFAVLYLHAEGSEVGSAVSNGLRFQQITAILPQELCCSLLTDYEEAAHKIIVLTVQMVLKGGAGVLIGTIIPGQEPFAAATEMVGVVCAEHPYVDEDFNVVRDADGKIEMQVITLIPASAAEIAFATERGADALFEVWEEQETDLADLSRPSAV